MDVRTFNVHSGSLFRDSTFLPNWTRRPYNVGNVENLIEQTPDFDGFDYP